MLKRILTEDKNIQLIQDNVDQALTPIQNSAMSDSALLTGINLVSGQDNLVQHKQAKQLQYWILSGINAQSTVWSPTTSKLSGASSNSSYLNLRCSTSCVVNLVVG